jgi:hypothetical protein
LTSRSAGWIEDRFLNLRQGNQIRRSDAPRNARPASKKEQANKSLAKEAKEELARAFRNSVSGIYGTTKKGKYVSEADAIKEG